MSPNRRIILNIIATYGRSLYALVIGLIAGRWTLRSLGEVDYGLMGVVGGLTAFVGFLNGLMASAVSRFYAYVVGQAKAAPVNGIELCREWFNTAVVIHTILPLMLVVVGYPSGVWAIENFLTIPFDRIHSCIWVWRFACLTCLVSMMSVPYQAMYVAKQEIAELTVYSFCSTTINFIFLCYMITHPGFWLTRFSAWTCLIAITPAILIVIRALVKYQECKFVRDYWWNIVRMKRLFSFAAGRFVCAFALMIYQNGRAVLVNKLLGPARNAAMAISNTVTSHTITLMSAISSAFGPAITNAYGAGNYALARSLCYRLCKFGTLAIAIFAIPLLIEVDSVMRLWLGTPPAGAASLCACCLVEHCISRLVDGHVAIVFANGKMMWFNITESFGYFVAFALAWLLLALGFGLIGIGYALILCTFYTVPVKLYFARKLGGMSIRHWINKIALPIIIVVVVSVCVGLPVRFYIKPSLGRVLLTTMLCEVVFLPLVWFIVLDEAEKLLVRSKLASMLGRINVRS